jgi:beta-glucanase (GH16 family)
MIKPSIRIAKQSLLLLPGMCMGIINKLPAQDVHTAAYHLVWSDEFNGTNVDTSVWHFETGASGWGNHEQEYYQPANATVENGNLVITAKKDNSGTHPYTSARMKTQGSRAFVYGKLEARMKLPVGLGLWPAFWMLGADVDTVPWPRSGEIDIMEHINTDSIIYGTMHWFNGKHVQSGGHLASSPAEWHVYGIEWDADSIRWYVDNMEYHSADITKNNTEAFHHPFFFLLNLAVGGDWPKQIINDSLLPAKMYVDWVRVYQKER